MPRQSSPLLLRDRAQLAGARGRADVWARGSCIERTLAGVSVDLFQVAGRRLSTQQLAQVSGQTEAYVRQLLSLAFLAPDITEGILLGKQPRRLTVDRLVRMKLPLSWQAHRRVLNNAS